jgi:hypothetical protein
VTGKVPADPAEAARREARIMARVTEDARVKGRTPGESLACMTDLVRRTLEYPADQYTKAVRADIERLRGEGYAELAVRNCWTSRAWKGISSSWRDGATGQLTEVQFHTPESRAARDQTYPDYLRLRDAATTDAERAAIMASVRAVYAGAPAEAVTATRMTYYAISDAYSTQDQPAGVLRRVEHPGGQRDEAFGRDLRWRHTFLLYSWERGNLDNTMHPIGADRAQRLTDQIRRAVTRHGR